MLPTALSDTATAITFIEPLKCSGITIVSVFLSPAFTSIIWDQWATGCSTTLAKGLSFCAIILAIAAFSPPPIPESSLNIL